MRQISVDKCPANPWLDAAVARVLGWKLVEEEDFESSLGKFHFLRFFDECQYKDVLIEGKLSSPDNAFCPSRDIVAALDLIANLEATADIANEITGDKVIEIRLEVLSDLSGNVTVMGGPPKWEWLDDITFNDLRKDGPLAIVRVFLKAKGILFVEIPDD